MWYFRTLLWSNLQKGKRDSKAWSDEESSGRNRFEVQPRLANSKATALFGGLTAGLLLASVGARAYQDSPLFSEAGSLSDPVVAALLAIEVVPLVIGAVLGLAAAWIAWLNWRNRLRTRTSTFIVFGLIALAGLLFAIRAAAPEFLVGWLLVVLSGGASGRSRSACPNTLLGQDSAQSSAGCRHDRPRAISDSVEIATRMVASSASRRSAIRHWCRNRR
jgi:hypothetical protein